MQIDFRHAMIAAPHTHNRNQTRITHHVNMSVRKLLRTFQTHRIHRFEFFFGDFLHPHATAMKSKSLRQYRFSCAKNCWYFGFHRHIRRRNYLTYSVFFHLLIFKFHCINCFIFLTLFF